ncbi:integrase [Billgrantia desiderata SP1]|uniref:site-specific integrase n=1 Tax=Billgrantia desiderata TaxID=52021 RepID=UPI000A3A994A|nr:site-specific integrase [Halomonas desiderata]OUE44364.1 integrase [Halomonas desiderata SP1]
MEKVKGTSHPRLYRRAGTYYHRAAVPVDIRDTYPKREETFSLKTSDYHEALRRVRKAAAEVDQKFEAHRRWLSAQAKPLDALTADQIEHLAARYYASLLEEDEEARSLGYYAEGHGKAGSLEWEQRDFDADAETVEALAADTRSQYARGQVSPFFEGEAEEVLAWEGVEIALADDSPSWRLLARALQEAHIKALQAKQARNEGEVVPTPQAPAHIPGRRSIQPQGTSPQLSSLVEAWVAEKARGWREKTANSYRVSLGHFITVTGDKPLNHYTKEDGRAFKEVLLTLPSNWNKKRELKALPVDKAAERARELGMDPMSDKNVNKVMGYVSEFWNWAKGNYDECPANPLHGLKLKIRKRVREERDPFTLQELRTIFHAPIFTGCKSPRFWRHPGNIVLWDSGMFWVPLVSLFSGMRMGEILQLYVTDVRSDEEEGIDYIDINAHGEDKSLKTVNSWRRIPIHPELKRLGFLEYVQQRQQEGSQRLFPDMPMGEDGYYSSVYSKRFRHLLDSLKIKRDKNAFHSFRHNFEDACRNSGISKEIMNSLQGHAEQGQSERYGEGFYLLTLNKALQKVTYRGLDLSHLHHNKRGTT